MPKILKNKKCIHKIDLINTVYKMINKNKLNKNNKYYK